MCLAFDRISNFAFIGDYSGGIHMVKLEEGEEFKFVTTLKGHAGWSFITVCQLDAITCNAV